jgi:hypothetical protein
MSYLIRWLLRMSRFNLYCRENLDPSLLPPILRQSFGEAMLGQVDDIYRMKILMIGLQLWIWSKFLNGTMIPKKNMRYFLTRISKLEGKYDIPSILPLSAVSFPRNYKRRVREVVSHAQNGEFSNRYHHFVKAGTNERVADLDVVNLQTTHNNGIFQAILVSGGVLMGRINDPLGLKMSVVKSPWVSKEKVSMFIFDPIRQILLVGRGNGTVMFYEFTDNFESITPCFAMTLIASVPFTGNTPCSVRRITANPSGSLFVIEYKCSPSVLVSIDAQNNVVTIPFIPESLVREIGGMSAIAFFGESMAITTHWRKCCVWDLKDLSDFKLVSIIEPMKFLGNFQQIITCDVMSFLFRTTENIFFGRFESDAFTTLQVMVELPVYGRFMVSQQIDFERDSMALFGDMVVLVVPSTRIVVFLLLKDDAIHLLLRKKIKTPTCWSYDPRTSVFHYYYESCGKHLCAREFRV